MKLLDVVHPAARTLVDIAKSQDSEVGDGTTSVVTIAGEILNAAKPFIEDGLHPQVIIRAYRQATALALAQSPQQQQKLARQQPGWAYAMAIPFPIRANMVIRSGHLIGLGMCAITFFVGRFVQTPSCSSCSPWQCDS